jgi:hypothetical protein
MVLVMKNMYINQNIYGNVQHVNIEVHAKKPNLCKNISPIFEYLNFICQTITNFRSNSSSVKKDYYNNLAFEVHANNN